MPLVHLADTNSFNASVMQEHPAQLLVVWTQVSAAVPLVQQAHRVHNVSWPREAETFHGARTFTRLPSANEAGG
jgi:hypothetical protein